MDIRRAWQIHIYDLRRKHAHLNGAKYYAHFLLYVDDCLVINHAADTALHELDRFFKMNTGSIVDPNMYLGAKLGKIVLKNGVEAWATSA